MEEATLVAAGDRTPPDPGPVLSSVMERQLQEEKCQRGNMSFTLYIQSALNQKTHRIKLKRDPKTE